MHHAPVGAFFPCVFPTSSLTPITPCCIASPTREANGRVSIVNYLQVGVEQKGLEPKKPPTSPTTGHTGVRASLGNRIAANSIFSLAPIMGAASLFSLQSLQLFFDLYFSHVSVNSASYTARSEHLYFRYTFLLAIAPDFDHRIRFIA